MDVKTDPCLIQSFRLNRECRGAWPLDRPARFRGFYAPLSAEMASGLSRCVWQASFSGTNGLGRGCDSHVFARFLHGGILVQALTA